ncbi:MAG: TIGR01458 family HAD-type hydrolase, partial [Rhodothermia bacterium]
LFGVRGLLVDLDGVLYVGDEVIPGAAESLERIKSAGYPIRGVTNTTTKSTATLGRRLASLGLPLAPDEIVNAPRAAVQYLRTLDSPTVRLVLSDDAASEFDEFAVAESGSESRPDVIVIGDVGPAWDYRLLSELFGHLIEGAALVALHKGRYYQGPDGLILDIGGFVSALEYAASVEAVVIGKPSPRFFQLAVSDMGLEPDEVVMIGDDIESDVGGAQRAGLRGILVKTGKYRDHLVEKSAVMPDMIIESIADLPRFLGL